VDLRENLKASGWRQGVVLQADSKGYIQSGRKEIGYLVLSQTCDCLSPDFEKEPCFEVLPLKKIKQPNSSAYTKRIGPRHIRFLVTQNGVEVWVEAQMHKIQFVARTFHDELSFNTDITLSEECLRDVINWRAAKYTRTAFPDSFENIFRDDEFLTGFTDLVEEEHPLIDSLLIKISPFKEIDSSVEEYEIELRLMILPETALQEKSLEKLDRLAIRIETYLDKHSLFDTPKCFVKSYEDMNLFESRFFHDFTRYDYLSFGEE